MSGSSENDVDEELDRLCQCVVCLQTLILPVTWSCGHSFCKSCSAGLVLDMGGEKGVVRCPTCRKFANMASVRRFAVNTVLSALLTRTFPVGNEKREQQVLRDFERFHSQLLGPTAEGGFSGENGGAHSRGWELVIPSEKFLLKSPDVHAERNIVRDAEDYAMHLTFAPISTLKFVPCIEEIGGWQVRFALLEMEEDEAAEGFPLSLYEHDDSKYMDMSLVRQRFESNLICDVKVNGNIIDTLESDAIQGIAEFDLGTVFRGMSRTQMLQTDVAINIRDPESGLRFAFTFKLYTKRDNPRTAEHLKRTMKRQKPKTRRPIDVNSEDEEEELQSRGQEGEGESLDSSSEDWSDGEGETDDKTSLDGFIVSDEDDVDSASPSPAKTKKKHTKKKSEKANGRKQRSETSSEEEEELDVDDEDSGDEEGTPKVKGKKSKGFQRHRVEELLDSDDDTDKGYVQRTKKLLKHKISASEAFVASFLEDDDEDEAFDDEDEAFDDDEESPEAQRPRRGRGSAWDSDVDETEEKPKLKKKKGSEVVSLISPDPPPKKSKKIFRVSEDDGTPSSSTKRSKKKQKWHDEEEEL